MRCSGFGQSMVRRALMASACVLLASASASASASAQAQGNIASFTPGDLVISTVSTPTPTGPQITANGGNSLDTASPITLSQFSLSNNGTVATADGNYVLPQLGNSAISGEYGSASEGILQLSGNGHYLTIMGYGVNANAFNAAVSGGTAAATYGGTALGQTTSANVARVVGLISADGYTDTSTRLTNVYNGNNPRSAVTIDGTSFYISGQGGSASDGTGGVFYATDGATTATAINVASVKPTGTPNGTANPLTATETRTIEIVNLNGVPTVVVSRDYGASGSPNDATDLRTLTNSTGGLPTSSSGLQATRLLNNNTSSGLGGNTLGGNTGSVNITANLANGVNNSRIGSFVYLSPEQFFFANATTLYIADSGSPKNGSNGAGLGLGGLQKWSLVGGVWVLDYDIFQGLNLVSQKTANSATNTAAGVTGLFGLTGVVVGNQVELFATSYGLNELSPSFLYEVTDTLSNTDASVAEGATGTGIDHFTTLYSAPAGTLIRGVSFAPVPEPVSLSLFGVGVAACGLLRRRRK